MSKTFTLSGISGSIIILSRRKTSEIFWKNVQNTLFRAKSLGLQIFSGGDVVIFTVYCYTKVATSRKQSFLSSLITEKPLNTISGKKYIPLEVWIYCVCLKLTKHSIEWITGKLSIPHFDCEMLTLWLELFYSRRFPADLRW